MKIFVLLGIAGVALAQSPKPSPSPRPESRPKPGVYVDTEEIKERARELAERTKEISVERVREIAERAEEIAREHVYAAKMDFGVAWQIKDRAMEQADREYERGMRALDKRQWDEASMHFGESAAVGKGRADGALYWKAYALAKLGRGKEATAALDELAKAHPQSRWLNDAKIMRVEIAQAAGKPLAPESAEDDEIKLLAINALMQSDSERAIPLLEKLLTSQSSPKLRERALFVLAQSPQPKARDIVTKVAEGGSNPDLQLKAIRHLGSYEGRDWMPLMNKVYAASNDPAIKREVLNGYMRSGQRDRLFAVAKSDANPEMRQVAARHLGAMGATTQLADLYGSESSTEVRRQLLGAMAASGNSQKLIEVAKVEQDPELRRRAIEHLGNVNSAAAGDALVGIYQSDADTETKKRVLRALGDQDSGAKRIVEIARKETNPELRRAAVERLSRMRSKEATDFLAELLNK